MNNLLGYLMIGVIRLMGLASLATAQRVGRRIGGFLWLRKTRSREVARTNLRLCYPEKNDKEINQMVHDTLLQNGMTGAEMGVMWGYEPDQLMGLIRHVNDGHLLDDLAAGETGVLIMVPHLGNWEIISTYVASRCQVTAMYRPAKMKTFSDWMVKRREAVGANMVPTTGEGVKALFRLLSEGRVVGFLPDQEPKRNRGVYAGFMGVPTLTPNLPHQMIQETGARVVFAFAERLPDAQGFDLHFVAADEGQYDPDPVVAATAMNATIARCIETCPDQYQWTYKRFKRQPEGKRNPYKAAGVP